jgi:DNA-binding CsgD family transcriptional regulator
MRKTGYLTLVATRVARTRLALACVALGAFALMLGLEVAGEDEPFRALDFAGDALQIAVVVGTAVTSALLATRLRAVREEQVSLIRELGLSRGEKWRREARSYVDGLSGAIEKQFEHWGLTAAEREISLLMLKGLHHTEIAALRGTTAATVRHQAKAIYQKAGVEGRPSFCAFFLEDLLPGDRTPSSPTPEGRSR